ncbi:hypothetical protein [Maridesulfovibrio zosterae]|uniref:hypothetical protein n=1 Tax=Maridesulfovibrio zosterae TaxID=82171 RepID=UPI0004256961|nr:hypothetical protein [Maridesulfovibrio zosterae]
MLKRVVLLVVCLMVGLVGCAHKHKKPVIENNCYKSLQHTFQVEPPEGWDVSFNRPEWFPSFLIPNNSRYTERAYFSNQTAKSCIMIESKRLTWAKQNIHPAVITYTTGGVDKAQDVCKATYREIERRLRAEGMIDSYDYYCNRIQPGRKCYIDYNCLESTMEAVYTKNKNYIMVQKEYIAGERLENLQSKVDTGWRIYYVLYTPIKYKKAGEKALQYVIDSTTELNHE